MSSSPDIKEKGLVGKIFFPSTSVPRPAIIVLSGSDGGAYEGKARAFASEGYVGVALCYFNGEGVPNHLENIPLEYFLHAMRWVKSLPEVESEKVHLYGPSRGGELVLLLASTFPTEMTSVVAMVPSCVTYGGIPNEKEPAWTLSGKPLPIAPTPSKKDALRQLETKKSVDSSKIFLAKMQDQKCFEDALIKVEHIQCPLLLISGKDDKMWPSSLYVDLIMRRLDAFNSRIPREHLCYENVGHMIVGPGAPIMTKTFQHPVTGLRYEVGGEPKAQIDACKDSWEKILKFYEQWSGPKNRT